MTTLPSADLTRDLALLEHHIGAYRTPDALLRVSGDDRLTWLQGQLTQDVSGLKPGEAAYGLLLHPNGKIMADVDVLCRAEDLVLVCARDVLDEVSAYLDRYIMMEDVDIEPLAGTVLALQGPKAAALREALTASLAADRVFEVDRLGLGGLLVLGSLGDGMEPLELPDAVVDAEGDWVSEGGVALARLRAGRPLLGVDFGPTVLPQVAGLSRRAVSFQKGCYRGQEPVVMLEHRGSPPKRLVRLSITGDSAPSPGTSVCAADGAVLGAITSAARAPDGVIHALGTLKRGAELAAVTSVGSDTDDRARLAARALEFVE